MSAILAGVAIGQNLASTMIDLEQDWVANKTMHGEVCTYNRILFKLSF